MSRLPIDSPPMKISSTPAHSCEASTSTRCLNWSTLPLVMTATKDPPTGAGCP
eukprot:TRINITY_DN33542_c0_g1_i1.p4 TRINITY_DN33542_c0_g1~~TRINITY_DN33542_c0_g1_i1.p4  ORF type:complete len:53 (+),score=3.91 TRINITY_DN33542_c0_g1_i1:216-374(+)